ncbi:hypothetical protein SAMN05421841_3048 [Chryseobacterium wanjuense]|uniref:Uncharacterized protein n=1 Tax=Chryseobacterium wanjuense TaxID=356305 RepID=A0A1I0RPS5_9FLAO|nr:hypothetical protein SAMN05421841_3048 [Chryseobacterium wanjuense]
MTNYFFIFKRFLLFLDLQKLLNVSTPLNMTRVDHIDKIKLLALVMSC